VPGVRRCAVLARCFSSTPFVWSSLSWNVSCRAEMHARRRFSQACRGTDRIREIEGVRASLVTRRRKEKERAKNAHVVCLMTLRMMMTTLCGKTLAVVVLPLNENVIKDRIRTSMSAINTGQSLVFFLLFHSLTRQYRSLMAKKVR
jgi:hypothetical protein